MARPPERESSFRADRSSRVVAVTGSASFIGRNLLGLLEEDPHIARVVSFDMEAPVTAGSKTKHYGLDLAQPNAQERLVEVFSAEHVDTVVHLGFLPSPVRRRALSHEVESIGTLRVVNACRQTSVNKLVAWSQTVLYGALPTNPNFLSERSPLQARREEPFFADKIQAENEIARFGSPGKGRVVTILRTGAILGPRIRNYLTRYLSHRVVPMVLGFDPLWQFLHEADAVAAFKLAVDRDVAGTFNIVGSGVLPLSMVIRLAGRTPLPLPRSVADVTWGSLWLAQLADMPSTFIDYLQYLCVADGSLAEKTLGFVPAFSSREALLDYANAQHLRDAKLMAEKAQ
jgi:UDP-glucose 4-epimerase